MPTTKSEASAAVQIAAEARRFAHARAALALSLLAKAETDEPRAQALAHAARQHVALTHGGVVPLTGWEDVNTFVEKHTQRLTGPVPPDWQRIVEEAVGVVVRDLWGVEL